MTKNVMEFSSQKERVAIVAELVGSGNKVLELGVGDGTITKKLLGKNNKVITADATNAADYKFDFNKFRYPVPDESFDVIVLAEVIEHLLHPIAALQECHRILKDDGRLILTTPNMASLKNIISILFLGKLTYSAEPDAVDYHGHVCDYWFKRIKDVVEKAEFKIKRYETTSSYLVLTTIPKFLYPKRFGEFIILELIKK